MSRRRRIRPRLLHFAAASCALVSSCARPTPNDAVPSRIASTGTDTEVAEEKPAPPPIIGRLGAAREGSGVLLADLDGRRVAYVADEDDAAVRVIDLEDDREISSMQPGGVPARMVMLADGRLVVSLRDAAQVVVLRGGGSTRSPLVADV